MSIFTPLAQIGERMPFPDTVTSAGISLLVGRTRRRLAKELEENAAFFAREMQNFPIAQHTARANEQHYELPPRFFELTLGPRRKYSCCYYENALDNLAEAEVHALEETVHHAKLADGQRILELGCGWGSLTLFMAEKFPRADITAVSNSAPQRAHIEAQAKARGLSNVTIITADMNDFKSTGGFDRVVSVEMFEHMSNWRQLLSRVHGWLKPEGRLFIHIFTHKTQSYRFNHQDQADWIGRHFFTGGIMPSHGLMRQFNDLFHLEQEWRWNGSHYARTARHWLENFDANIEEIDRILAEVYGADAELWRRRWRLFYLATAGLFGHAGGTEWGVSHYLLRPATQA